MRLSMNTRYAVIHASFWGAYGSLWAFIALVLEYNGFASAQVGIVTSCATLLSVFLSPAVSSFLDARPGLENRHGAMALLTLAAALCLLVWLVPLPRPFVLGACFALIGAFLSSTPPFQNAMAMDANRCGIPVVYGFCRGRRLSLLRRRGAAPRLCARASCADTAPAGLCRADRLRTPRHVRLPPARAPR